MLNALSCISLCDHYNISAKTIRDALKDFTGAHRRLEYKGSYNDITVLDDFSQALSNFDHIIIADIYAARETNTYGVSSKDIVERINSTRTLNHCEYISDFKDIVSYVKEHAKPKDIILTLGAGNVTDIGPMILK